MAVVTAQSETRNVDRILAHTRDVIMREIQDHAFNHSPVASIFFGQALGDFGSVARAGQGKMTQTGGESIVVRMNLGKGNVGTMAGAYGQHGTDPSDTVRFSRANWKHYWANITISDTETLINSGPEAISSHLEFETRLAFRSLGDFIADHFYSNSGVSERITDITEIISANDSVQGLSGATYSDFNSRGLSVRGTAPANISFTSGSFATQGIADMRRAYNNASEGSIRPNTILSSYSEFEFYEAQLTPEQRFTSRQVGDGSFANLAFKDIPWIPDDKAPTGSIFLLNVGDALAFTVLGGADFAAKPFKQGTNQEVRVSEIQLKGNMIVKNRKMLNKLTGVTA